MNNGKAKAIRKQVMKSGDYIIGEFVRTTMEMSLRARVRIGVGIITKHDARGKRLLFAAAALTHLLAAAAGFLL